MRYAHKRSRPLLWILAMILPLIPAAPLLAQQVDDPGELQIVTSHETEKDSGVWVDAEYIGYLRDFWGNKKIMLAPGEHEISVRKFGYKAFTQKIRMESGKIQFLPIMLEIDVATQYPTQDTATLKINVSPPEAAVLVDGAYVGYASQVSSLFKSLTVRAGKRNVRIEMRGYSPYESNFELAAGETYQVRAVLTKGGAELEGAPRVIQAVIHDGATSLQLRPGRLYLYGMVVGGQGTSTLFSLGQYASVFHEGGTVGAAAAYGDNGENTYTTQTAGHLLGGASVGGAWQDMRAFYGSNASAGASDVRADFTVDQNSFVVILGMASSQQQISLEGVPALEMDSFHGGAGAAASMVIAHSELAPGKYTVVQRSSALAKDADRNAMAGLVAVFVFSHH